MAHVHNSKITNQHRSVFCLFLLLFLRGGGGGGGEGKPLAGLVNISNMRHVCKCLWLSEVKADDVKMFVSTYHFKVIRKHVCLWAKVATLCLIVVFTFCPNIRTLAIIKVTCLHKIKFSLIECDQHRRKDCC